jgi:hypothetical protein
MSDISLEDLKKIPGFVDEGSEGDSDLDNEPTDEGNNNKKDKKDLEGDLADKINALLDEHDIVEGDDEGLSIKTPKKDEKKQSSLLDTLNILREKKVIDFEDPAEDEEPYSEEEAEDILEEALGVRVEEAIESKIKDLDPLTKTILKYALDGGNVGEFIKSIGKVSTSVLSSQPDLGKVEVQESVVKEILTAEGFDNEYIDDQLEFLKDGGKLKGFAEKKYKIWKENNEKTFQKQLEDQKERGIEAERRFRETRNRIQKTINDSEQIGGMKIGTVDKKELAYYLMDRSIKIEGSPNITKFHADLGEVLRNETASIQLAKLLRSRNKQGNFDFEIIKKDIETEVTRNIKRNLRRTDTKIPVSSKTHREVENKPLWEILKDE